jgi:hypothetical protein
MANDTQFIDGLVVQAPRDNAPEYVKARIWIKRAELIAWLQAQTGDSINADVKVSQGGKWYAAVDNWKPQGNGTPRSNAPKPQRAPEPDFVDDDIPF